MSEIIAGLQELRRLNREIEDAARHLFDPHILPILNAIENDVDHLLDRTIDHLEATQFQPIE